VRADDTEAVIRGRLAVYHEHTAPLVDFYARRGVLRRVDGTREMDEVFVAITKVLEPQPKG